MSEAVRQCGRMVMWLRSNAVEGPPAVSRRALRIAGAYLVVGLLWIVGSDYVVDRAFGGTEWLSRSQSLKGYAFVTLTSVFVYLVARREMRAVERAQAELAAANRGLEELAAFPRLSPHPIVRLSRAGGVTYANDAARDAIATHGLSSVAELLPPDWSDTAAGGVLDNKPLSDVEHRVRERVLRWSFFPETDGGDIYGYGRDCTEEISLGARLVQAEKLEAIGRLTAGVAHDFNNLINAVGITSQLIEGDDEATEAIREYSHSMRTAADQAAVLVSRLLAFGRKQPSAMRCLDLNDEVRAFAHLAHLVARPGVSVSVNASEEPLRVWADPARLNQVLMNLVVNANDAIAENGRIEIMTGRSEETAGLTATIRVTDTGSGIEPEVLPYVFEPFFTTKADRGTGLGLSTVREIVMDHGGRIEVESTPGEGSCFVVRWPLVHSGG